MTETKGHIDMEMRVSNDGGPLFDLMDKITEPALRNERLCQLAYLGLMVERGGVGLALVAPRGNPAPNAETFVPLKPTAKRSQRKER